MDVEGLYFAEVIRIELLVDLGLRCRGSGVEIVELVACVYDAFSG